jgi:ABC-type transporter MlaC component
VRSGKEDVRLDYRLRQTPEGWRIIDIYAQGGISMLAMRRAEFSSFLKRQGFEELVDAVEAKAAR